MAIRKTIDGKIETVGRVPQRISSICSIFIRRGGSILCTVKGNCRYSLDLLQGGLEIPLSLECISHDKKEAAKAERLLESALNIKSKKVEKKVLKEMNEDDTDLGISEAVPLLAPKKKLSAKDVFDLIANDEVEPPSAKNPKLHYERIIMGQELLDREISFCQH